MVRIFNRSSYTREANKEKGAWLWVAVALSLFLAAGFWGIRLESEKCSTWSIDIVAPFAFRDAEQLKAEVSYFLSATEPASWGTELPWLGMGAATSKVELLPWVKKVRVVRRSLCDQTARVHAKWADLVYLNPSGLPRPVAGDGALLPAIDLEASADFPFLIGPSFEIDADLRRQALKIFGMIPIHGYLSRPYLSELMHSSENGFELRLMRRSIGVGKEHIMAGPRIMLGAEALELRMERIHKVLTYLHSAGIHARVVDANYRKTVRVKPGKRS